jgi:hypothetical protein
MGMAFASLIGAMLHFLGEKFLKWLIQLPSLLLARLHTLV